MQFLIDHYDEILALLGVAYTLISGVVALTPTREDDAFLARLMQRISFFAPRNVPGVFSMPGRMPRSKEDPRGASLLVVLLCFAPMLGACAHAKVAGESARAAACVQVETQCIERAERGEITVAAAEACVSCARSTCDAIRERMTR
jgi:hypothetical protein